MRVHVSVWKVDRLFDEWQRLEELARAAYNASGATAEYSRLCNERDAAWDKYVFAAQIAEHHEEEAKHDENMRGVGECENVDE